MAFNGSGVFNRIYSWVTDAANNLNVDATRMDTDTNDIAAGLSMCITKDGQQTITNNIPMSGFKFTGLGSGSASGDSASFGQVLTYASHPCEGRLTLSTGVPVPTTDVNGSTLYFTPYKGNKLALYDGSNWIVGTFSELSIAIPNATALYDVFCYLNSGTPTLEILAWTNDTTRATALSTQDGVYVKSGAPTRRYLGSVRAIVGATGLRDQLAFRHVWNYYNRVLRPMVVVESTGSWTYTTATIRQVNANPANQLDFVIGVTEEPVWVETWAQASNTSASVGVQTGFGLDSTTAFASSGVGIGQGEVRTLGVASAFYVMPSSGRLYPSAGRHYVAWLEESTATGTTTWYGSNLTGIQGEIWG